MRRRLIGAAAALGVVAFVLLACALMFALHATRDGATPGPEAPSYGPGESPPTPGGTVLLGSAALVAGETALGLVLAALGPKRRRWYQVVAAATVLAVAASLVYLSG